jgi:hypothetical protein
VPRPKDVVPVPSFHKSSGQISVRIAGGDDYSGPWGNPTVQEKATRLNAEHLPGYPALPSEGRWFTN